MDLIFLEKLQRYGKFMGISSARTSYKYTNLLALMELLLIITHVYLWLEIAGPNDPIAYYIIQCSEICTIASFLIANYYAVVRLRSHWNSLLENCREVDSTLSQKGLQVNSIKIHLLTMFLFNVYYIFFFVLGFFEKRNITEIISLIYTLQYMFLTYKKLVITVITNLLTSIIENRYKLLAILLMREFHSNREDVKRTLEEIERLMEVLMNCTNYVDVITGGTSFTLILHAFTATMASFDSVSYLWEYPSMSSSINKAVLAYFCQRIFGCILSVTIIIGCGKVELAHYEIINACNEFRTHVKDLKLRDDLIKFYSYAMVLSPKFTAIGFFRLKPTLCLSFFSMLVTYFIFVGQLYASQID